MNRHLNRDIFLKSLAAILILAFIYTTARAAAVSMSHDEAITYEISKDTVFQIVNNQDTLHPTNNHILNTLLIKLSVFIFGLSELAVRLPALLGCAMYLIGTFLILSKTATRWRLVLGGAALAFNPFLIDMFSAARGYSLALGFFMLALYYIIMSAREEEQAIVNVSMSAMLLFLSTLSNLSFLNMFMTGMAVLTAIHAYRAYKNYTKAGIRSRKTIDAGMSLLLTVFYTILFMNVFVRQVATVRYYTDTFYGGTGGIMDSTAHTLVQSVFGTSWVLNAIAESAVMATFLLAVFLLAYSYMHEQTGKHRDLTFISAYLSVFILITYALNMLFSAEFPEGRAATYIIPLFILLYITLWEMMSCMKGRQGTAANIISTAVIVVVLVQHAAAANITHYNLWEFDSSTKDAMQDLMTLHPGGCTQANCTTIGVDWVLQPTVNFYREKYDLDRLKKAHRDGYDCSYDHYYVLQESKGQLDACGAEIIHSYDRAGTYLAAKAQRKV